MFLPTRNMNFVPIFCSGFYFCCVSKFLVTRFQCAASLVAISLFPIFAVTVHGTTIKPLGCVHATYTSYSMHCESKRFCGRCTHILQMPTQTQTHTRRIYEPYESANHNNITILCVRGFTLRLQSLTFDWVETLSTVNCFACITSHQISRSLSISHTRFSFYSFKWKTYPS